MVTTAVYFCSATVGADIFGVSWTPNGTHPALRTPHSALCTLHSALRTLHFALRTPHSALRTPHSALRTPHSALRTPHFLITDREVLIKNILLVRAHVGAPLRKTNNGMNNF